MASTAIVIMGIFPATLASSAGTNGAVPIRTSRARIPPGAVTSCRVPVFPCNTRNAGKPDVAASSHGNWDTWPERGQTIGRAPAWCSCAAWNVVVLDLALHYSLFSPRSRLHTTPDRSRSDSMGFRPENLLFLEPVLLQPREGSQSRIGGVRLTTALFVIQVRPATRAQPAAIALAYDFHRQ